MVAHTRLTGQQAARLVGSGVFIVIAFLVVAMAARPRAAAPQQPTTIIHLAYPSTAIFTSAIHAAEQRSATVPVTGVLVNHHLVAANFIADTLATVRHQRINRIILLAPNHFSAGIGRVTTANALFRTPLGDVRTDDAFIRQLTAQGIVTNDATPFQAEHGVYNILPFLRTYFPQATVVPMITKVDTAVDVIDALAAQLEPMMTEHTLIIASLDFAHHQTDVSARMQDAQTLPVLQTVAPELYHEAYVDSPLTLRLFLRLMQARSATTWTLLHHSNSAEETGQFDATDVTSHITGLFSRLPNVLH